MVTVSKIKSDRYTLIAITLHWIIALAVLLMIGLGLTMTSVRPGSVQQFELYQLHKSIGITILVLSLARLGWRLANPPPPLPNAMPAWEQRLARFSHITFYGLLLGLPLLGWLMVSASPLNLPTYIFGVVNLPHLPQLSMLENKAPVEAVLKVGHKTLAWMMILLAILHIGAALRHQFVLKDDIFSRILPWRWTRQKSDAQPKDRR